MEKEVGKGGRDELGTGGRPVQANQDSGQTRPHGGACAIPNLRSHLDKDSGGAECKYWSPGMFSEGVTFAILHRDVFAAGHNLAPEGALRPPLGRNAMSTPDRSASALTPKAPAHAHTPPGAGALGGVEWAGNWLRRPLQRQLDACEMGKWTPVNQANGRGGSAVSVGGAGAQARREAAASTCDPRPARP